MALPKRLSVTRDDVSKVVGAITALTGKQVLVGIPESTSNREGPINNAGIGYVMENGSPEHNVPARPWLNPGAKKSIPDVLPLLRQAADAALEGNPTKSDYALAGAGSVAVVHVRRQIGSNIPPPLAPSTIRGRKYQRGTKSRRPEEKKYLGLIKGGTDPASAQTAAGIVSLINTGELRNSVSSVVRKRGK